jgi:hypothetical protein
MSKFTSPLENIRVASPCAQDWNEMVGDERARFCGACKLNVYNLSGMSRREAENLIFKSEEGRLCVRFYRRTDGSVLTKDCPVGWHAIQRNISKTATAFASLVFTALGAIGLTNYFAQSNERHTMGTVSNIETPGLGETAIEEINSNTAVQFETVVRMGNISPKNTQIVGIIVNRTEQKRGLKKQRRR